MTDAAGQPVDGATIFVRGDDGEWMFTSSHARTAHGGRCEVQMLPPGRYTLMARTPDGVSPESEPIDATKYGVPFGDVATVELQLTRGAGLRASLLDTTGHPLRARFSVRDSRGREQTGTSCFHDRARILEHGYRSDELWLTPLLPGKYQVTATAPDGRQASAEVVLRAGVDEGLVLKLE